MDLKGITWVGHVYQKFETMCLEVEEVMYQDTIKYVENQVQTVGASVKKFYSDVMQDILPPSSEDQVKGTPDSNSLAGQHQEVEIHKKRIVGLKVASKPLPENSIDTADIDETASHDAFFHGFLAEDTSFQPSSEKHVARVCADTNSNLHDKISLDGERISREENLHPNERWGTSICRGKDQITTSSLYDLDKHCQPSSAKMAVSSQPSAVGRLGFDFEQENCDEFDSEKKGKPDSTSTEDCNETESRSSNSSCNCESENGSYYDGEIEADKFSFEGISICHSGKSDMSRDGVQSSNAFEPIGNLELEDSCVLVNGDGLNIYHHKDSKYKPYKKKIQDAISGRMRSTRKQEYKQLAVRYGEDLKSFEDKAESLMPIKLKQGTNGVPSADICESEWELL